MKMMCGLLMLFQLVLVSCNDTLLEEKQVACYFQYEYVNYAWGFGHSGFTGTYVWADPSNNLLFIFLSNRVCPDAANQKLSELNIRTKLHQAMYDLLLKYQVN